MAPDDVGAFYDWVERDKPSYLLGAAIKAWIDNLDQRPWQAPSVEITEMTVEGEYQTREALVLGVVDVIYQENYATGRVHLIDVRSHPPRPPVDLQQDT